MDATIETEEKDMAIEECAEDVEDRELAQVTGL